MSQPPVGFPPRNRPYPGQTGSAGAPWQQPAGRPPAPGWGPTQANHGFPFGPPPQTPPPATPFAQPGTAGWSSQPGAAGGFSQPEPWSRELGRRAPDPNSIDNFRPPRSQWPIRIGIGAVLIVVIAVALSLILPGGLAPVPTTSPTPTATASESLPPGAVAFEASIGRAAGYWRVVETRWSDGYVDILVEIQCQKGELSYEFYAFSHDIPESYNPVPSDRDPTLTSGWLSKGETAKGWVRFDMPHGAATMILAAGGREQVSALPIGA